jgi:formylglycine-generating enzyme required for sulfatase activity
VNPWARSATTMLVLLVWIGGADARRLYTITVEWESPRIEAFGTPFRMQLGTLKQIRIVANEDERKAIVDQWGGQVGDEIDSSTRVEMGGLSGWDYTVMLRAYTSLQNRDTLFSATILDLERSDVAAAEVRLPPEGEAAAAERLAHMVSRLLAPRASVSRWDSRRYGTVILDAGEVDGMAVGQGLVRTVDGSDVGRLRVTSVQSDESEALVEFGDIEVGDDFTVVVHEIPPSRVSPLYVRAPGVAGEFSVWVDGALLGISKSGYAEVIVWPGMHEVKLTGAVVYEERVEVGPTGYQLIVERQHSLQVNSSVQGEVHVRSVGVVEWQSLGTTGMTYDLPPGSYQIRVIADGYLPWLHPVQVSESGTKSVNVDLTSTTGMVRIPGGPFRIGHPAVNEQRQRNIVLDDYWIDTHEVTAATYRQFDPRYSPPASYEQSAPVVGVSYYQARDFCRAAGKRLPSEDEWERACRGETGARFGYGEYYDPLLTDARTENQAGSAPSLNLPPTAHGIYGMSGGVWEWCESNSTEPDSENQRALRGGAWRMKEPATRSDCVFRLVMSANKEGTTPFGFRCAADAD